MIHIIPKIQKIIFIKVRYFNFDYNRRKNRIMKEKVTLYTRYLITYCTVKEKFYKLYSLL